MQLTNSNASNSNIEEAIGVLWLILTVLLKQNDISGWWIVTGIHGIQCLLVSLSYAYKAKKIKEAKK